MTNTSLVTILYCLTFIVHVQDSKTHSILNESMINNNAGSSLHYFDSRGKDQGTNQEAYKKHQVYEKSDSSYLQNKNMPLSNLITSKRKPYEPETWVLDYVLADIFKNNILICGGVFYRNNLVLTSATYVKAYHSQLSVKHTNSHDHLAVVNVFFHDEHDWNQISYYSFAAIVLNTSECERNKVYLDFNNQANGAIEFEFIGWGYEHKANGLFYDVIYNITLPSLNNIYCNDMHRKLVMSYEFCAGRTKNNARAYFIMAGSPLFLRHQGKLILAGIYSWSEPSIFYSEDYAPLVFLKIFNFLDWIIKIDNMASMYQQSGSAESTFPVGWEW